MKSAYKIAAISDIHSNITALKAIFRELEKENIDDVAIAGDIIGDGPCPNEVIDFIRQKGAKVIAGNRENNISNYHKNKYQTWKDSLQIRPMIWTYEVLTAENLEFILNLPEQLMFEAQNQKIRMVHGSPRQDCELILKDDIDLINEALASVDEDVLICGHCHQHWSAAYNNTLIVNPGSAGLPFMQAGNAPYSVIVIENNKATVRECIAKYEIGEAIGEFHSSDIMQCGPWTKAVIASLETGNITTLAYLRHAKKYAKSKGWIDNGNLIPNEHWLEAEKTFDWNIITREF